MTLYLKIHVQGAEPYWLDDPGESLSGAIADEAEKIASAAGSDLLDDPGEGARVALRERVRSEATSALRRPGDTYRDPTGVRWSLVEAE